VAPYEIVAGAVEQLTSRRSDEDYHAGEDRDVEAKLVTSSLEVDLVTRQLNRQFSLNFSK